MADGKSIWAGLRRGLCRRCPTCGKGHLFDGYLKIRSPCDVCGVDNMIYPSDDMPPYITIFVSGHVLVVLVILTDRAFAPPIWLSDAIWLPAAMMLALALLPFMKGATVGLCWATNLVRQDRAT